MDIADAASLARMIDHTLLDPLATAEGIERLCDEALEWGIPYVCVSPNRVALAHGLVGPGATVCSVIGFPSGAHSPAAKLIEAELALGDGAREIDMVVNLGAAVEGDAGAIEAEVAAIVRVAEQSHAHVKTILETAALGPERSRLAARAALAGGAAWLKTSTGYHPAGGATVEDVRLLVDEAGDRAQVKASGGIRTLADARTMVAAGARRLGTSKGIAILTEARASS